MLGNSLTESNEKLDEAVREYSEFKKTITSDTWLQSYIKNVQNNDVKAIRAEISKLCPLESSLTNSETELPDSVFVKKTSGGERIL